LILSKIKSLSNYRKVIIESTPSSYKSITTKEFKYIEILRIFPTAFLNKIIKNRYLRKPVINIYKTIKPKAKVEIQDDDIEKFVSNINIKTVIKISKLLKREELYRDINQKLDNEIFIYDRYDPTVDYKIITQYYKDNIITTEFGVHVPSIIYTKE